MTEVGGGSIFKSFSFFKFFKVFKSRLLTGAMDSKISISIVIVGGYLAIPFSY